MKYTNKGNSNVGIQIEWKTGNKVSEYTSEQMKLAIRFDEPTDEEKQMYSVLKTKVNMSGNRKKQKQMLNAVNGARPESEMGEGKQKSPQNSKKKGGRKKNDKKKSKKRKRTQDEDDEDEQFDKEKQKSTPNKRGKPNGRTGLIGVYQKGKKYASEISIDGTRHRLGTFDTKKEAGTAYDRFVVDKSTAEVTYLLNGSS